MLTSARRSVMGLGGSKSGKPWARLMALFAIAIRVMRRMTESVKYWLRLLISFMFPPLSLDLLGLSCLVYLRPDFALERLASGLKKALFLTMILLLSNCSKRGEKNI